MNPFVVDKVAKFTVVIIQPCLKLKKCVDDLGYVK
jgi:hypothetical protein